LLNLFLRIVPEAIINEIVLINSFATTLLLLYMKVPDFCKLILYPETLLKVLMMLKSFMVEFLGPLRCKIISSANSDISTYYLNSIISSPSLVALTRNLFL
jgi:hypothetical protein